MIKIPDKSGGMIAGVDVGGTFTDLVVLDSEAGAVCVSKVPTTPDDQSRAVMSAIEHTEHGVADIDLIIHGTTTTTNALLERRLAKAGLITTRGFRDIIELGRRTRPNPYGLFGTYVPVVPRDLRLEVTERIEATGAVREPLDEDEFREAVNELIEAGCDALVIHFLHAYKNPEHERRAAEIALKMWPNSFVTTGHSLLSEAREFERGVTAAVNASVQPVLQRYVDKLRDSLLTKGYRRDFLMMNGNGGTTSSALVVREAVKTVMSGPASGVIAAARIAERAGISDLITYDMGGTSTDVALVRGGLLSPTRPKSNMRSRSMSRWWMFTRLAPVAAPWRGSTLRGCSMSVHRAPGPCRARSVLDAVEAHQRLPMRTCCWGGSIPNGCWPSTIRSTGIGYPAHSRKALANNWVYRPRRLLARFSKSPI